ncbi:TolB family protein [Nocardioides sp. MAHUQ-72]|uniref:TolB family protein n=1 Tax=unclassified Nocardioides TaxID=2615069 RepID=UPI00361EA851
MRRALLRAVPALVLVLGSTMSSTIDDASRAGAAASAPTNGRILFTHCEDPGGCQVYTANPDGSAVEQVTHGADSFQGDWSPDGERIAYVGTASGDTAIWIADADGSHARQLTPDDPASDDFGPRFTANGAWILFYNCLGEDCDGGISAIRPNGSGLHHVTPNSHLSYNLADQSPDGSRMTYMRWHVGGVKMAVYVSSADGKRQRRITPPRLEGWAPDWSPNGDRIAFASYVYWDRPAPSLFTVRPDGSRLTALTHPPFPHSDFAPAYAPDGAKVVFASDRRYPDFCCSDLFVVPASGGPARRVLLPFDASDPRWGTAPLEPGSAGAGGSAARSFTTGGPACAHVPQLARVAPCPAAPASPQIHQRGRAG